MPPLCILFHTFFKSFLIASVRDLCRQILSIFNIQNPEQCIKGKFIGINTIFNSSFFTMMNMDWFSYQSMIRISQRLG